jgi:hypothetical protein
MSIKIIYEYLCMLFRNYAMSLDDVCHCSEPRLSQDQCVRQELSCRTKASALNRDTRAAPKCFVHTDLFLRVSLEQTLS